MGEPYPIERESRTRIEEHQRKALRLLLESVEDRSEFYRRKMSGRAKSAAVTPSQFSSLPMTSKEDLIGTQASDQPYGGWLTTSVQECSILGFSNAIAVGMQGYRGLNLCATPGDMRSRVEAAMRGLAAGGSGPGDRTAMVTEVARSILHHAFLGALVELGSTPFQTGRGLTLRHVRHTLPALEPTQLLTHPTYARHLAALLEQEGITLPVERLFLWGEVGPSVLDVRRSIEDAWNGAKVRDVYAMEELGVLAAECAEGDGLHCFEDNFLYEVADPESGDLRGQGEPGELVITTLKAEAMPLIRYRTGDLVVMEGDGCPCGRTHHRLRVLGRVFREPSTSGAVDLAAIEDVLSSVDLIDGPYRVVVEPGGFLLETSAAKGAEPGEAAAALEEALAERGVDISSAVVPDMPRFYHRAIRIVDRNDIGLWQALAVEQRRLEG
jgi:phenylacetate-CoA ligase